MICYEFLLFCRVFVLILAVFISHPFSTPAKWLLFPLLNQCPPLNPHKRVVVFDMVEDSFKGHASALHCFGALSTLCEPILGFVQGKEDQKFFDSFRVKNTPIS
jgi:hypothetical protein